MKQYLLLLPLFLVTINTPLISMNKIEDNENSTPETQKEKTDQQQQSPQLFTLPSPSKESQKEACVTVTCDKKISLNNPANILRAIKSTLSDEKNSILNEQNRLLQQQNSLLEERNRIMQEQKLIALENLVFNEEALKLSQNAFAREKQIDEIQCLTYKELIQTIRCLKQQYRIQKTRNETMHQLLINQQKILGSITIKLDGLESSLKNGVQKSGERLETIDTVLTNLKEDLKKTLTRPEETLKVITKQKHKLKENKKMYYGLMALTTLTGVTIAYIAYNVHYVPSPLS